MASVWLGRMFTWHGGLDLTFDALTVRVAIAAAAAWLLPETWDWTFGTRHRWAPVYATAALAIYLVMNGRTSVFLYYQF